MFKSLFTRFVALFHASSLTKARQSLRLRADVEVYSHLGL